MNAACTICKRPLKDPRSLERGMGPVCARRRGTPFRAEPDDEALEKTRKLIDGLFGLVEESYAFFIPEHVPDVILRRDGAGNALANIPHKLVYHSPTGFEFGYGGSGPADLALNILAQVLPLRQAWILHQEFKWRFIAAAPREGGTIRGTAIKAWLENTARECPGTIEIKEEVKNEHHGN